jgi:hypothetical protein
MLCHSFIVIVFFRYPENKHLFAIITNAKLSLRIRDGKFAAESGGDFTP